MVKHKELLDLLESVKKRPAIYLKKPVLTHLPALIFGYSIGFSVGKEGKKDRDPFFGKDGFFEWYFELYPERESSIWEESFIKEANGNDELALNIFFEYLEKYKVENRSVRKPFIEEN